MAKAFWDLVERERVGRGMSKTDLSRLTGLTRASIDNLKTGRRAPLPRTVHALADALGIPREKAEDLAGLVSSRPVERRDLRVRREIDESGYSPAEKDLIHRLLDVLDQANRGDRGEGGATGQAEVG